MNPFKVMLVDDEILVIQHLKRLIAWADFGLSIVAESTSAVKALELFKENRPDIVIVDIYMPVMNGLEFIQRIQSTGYPVKILLLTSYRDFEYAKQAVELGVSGYLLKHELHSDKLINELAKLQNQLIQEKKKETILRRQYIRDLLENKHPSGDLVNQLFCLTKQSDRFILLLLRQDMSFPVCDVQIEATVSELDIVGYDAPLSDEFYCYAGFRVGVGLWIVLLEIKDCWSRYQAWESTHTAASELQAKFKEQHEMETITVVVSSPFDEIGELSKAYQRCQKILDLSFLRGREKIYHSSEFNIPKNGANLDWKPDMELIARYMDEENPDAVGFAVATLFNQVISGQYDFGNIKILCRELVSILNNFRVKHHLNTIQERVNEEKSTTGKWYTIDGIHEWFAEEFYQALMAANQSEFEVYSKRVLQMVRYIHKHYSEDITSDNLGQKLLMSGDHLRHIFKKETGQTVLDYLTLVRIEKAKKLLDSGNYKVYEVARMVGYKTSQYFSQVFRKIVGVNPIEYSVGKINENEH
jgi:two-component system response regulator YesN